MGLSSGHNDRIIMNEGVNVISPTSEVHKTPVRELIGSCDPISDGHRLSFYLYGFNGCIKLQPKVKRGHYSLRYRPHPRTIETARTTYYSTG